MEQTRSPEASQNCFLPTGTDRKAISTVGTEIFLYDEAEPLAYVCSETSMPPQSAGYARSTISSGKSALSRKSLKASRTSHREDRESSTMVYESLQDENVIQPLCNVGGSSSSKDKVSDFERALLSKFKEFAKTPDSTCSKLKHAESEEKSRMSRSENDSEDIEEIFIHKTKFFLSSSESDKLRNTTDERREEVFSTGVSDIEEAARDLSGEKQTNKYQISMSHQQHPIIGSMETLMENPVAKSPNRVGPPVQGKLSLRALKTNPPCFCLLEEIKKNNLVMEEDVFSSSKTEVESPIDFKTSSFVEKRVNVRQRTREWELLNEPPNSRKFGGNGAFKVDNLPKQNNRSNSIEIFEATGGEKEVENFKKDSEISNKASMKNRPIPAASDVNALTANIPYIRSQFEESRRPFKPPQWAQTATESKATEWSNSNTVQKFGHELASNPNSVSNEQTSNGFIGGTSERHLNEQLNGYYQAKKLTPNQRQEKYVKLPGLADAFDQRESNFRELTIKNGSSFESVNVLEELSMWNKSNQITELKREVQVVEGQVSHRKIETKDVATDVTTSLKNTKTQTFDKTMVDCYVQCDSHIVDENNGRNIIKNDHQEILVCNDNGDGVQLYNELGHPLTDMDGYLLKDSLGRFLVRLDDYGVPISCTNGQAIFMEDSRAWDSVKNSLSIIHQCKKKLIKRGTLTRKKQTSPTIRQVENAMENLKNTLEWADRISLDSVHDNTLQRFKEFNIKDKSRPLRSITMEPDKIRPTNNTSSLIAEMKSIARLRTALLEKVNFIVDNRKKLGKSKKLPTFPGTAKFPTSSQDTVNTNRLSDTVNLLQNQKRPYSPTYRAIKTLKESEANSEADSIPSSDNPVEKSLYKKSENVSSDLWKPSANGGKYNNDIFSARLKSTLEADNDLWIDSITGANEGGVSVESTGNSSFWRMIRNTGSNDSLPASTKKYTDFHTDKELSEMKLVSRDTENRSGTSFLGKIPQSGIEENHILCTLEKQYDIKIDDNWLPKTWNEEKSLFDANNFQFQN